MILKILNLQLVLFPDLQLFLFFFSNTLPKGEYVNWACSIILIWSDWNISLPVRNSYLPVLPVDNGYIFAASVLISYCSFSSLILSSIVMINFNVLTKRFFPKHEELSDARVVSITWNEYGFTVHFIYRFTKPWNSISDEWLNAICWSYIFLEFW